MFGSDGAMAMSPIECVPYVSKIGVNVVPLLVDFQTPLVANPT